MTGDSAVAIRDIRAEKGTLARGFLCIGESVAGSLEVPVAIINGAGDGPTLCLTAGVHATEYEPIDAVMRLIRGLDPKQLRGTVIAVPVANMSMYYSRTAFVSPIDGLNLNKIAPGNAHGSISEVLAQILLDEVIAIADFHIDLHAGDAGELLWPFAGYPLTGNAEQDRLGEAIARLYTPHMISLAKEGSSLPPFPGSIVFAASRRGIVSILAESGGDGVAKEADIQAHVDGIRNVMRFLGIMDGAPRVPEEWIRATDRFVVRARHAGYVRLKTRIGEHVAEDQHVADVFDVFGHVVEAVRTCRAGIVGLIWTHKVVSTGDPIVRCWTTEPAPPFSLTDASRVVAKSRLKNGPPGGGDDPASIAPRPG